MKTIRNLNLGFLWLWVSAKAACAQGSVATHETNVYTYLAPLTLVLIASELIISAS